MEHPTEYGWYSVGSSHADKISDDAENRKCAPRPARVPPAGGDRWTSLSPAAFCVFGCCCPRTPFSGAIFSCGRTTEIGKSNRPGSPPPGNKVLKRSGAIYSCGRTNESDNRSRPGSPPPGNMVHKRFVATPRPSARGRGPMRQTAGIVWQSTLQESERELTTRTIPDCRRVHASPSTPGAGQVWAVRHVRECERERKKGEMKEGEMKERTDAPVPKRPGEEIEPQ